MAGNLIRALNHRHMPTVRNLDYIVSRTLKRRVKTCEMVDIFRLHNVVFRTANEINRLLES